MSFTMTYYLLQLDVINLVKNEKNMQATKYDNLEKNCLKSVLCSVTKIGLELYRECCKGIVSLS